MIKYYNEDYTRMYATLEGGEKIALPRYYKDKLFDTETRQKQAKYFETLSLEMAAEKKRDFHANYGDNADYDRHLFESKRHAIEAFKRAQKSKRKKV